MQRFTIISEHDGNDSFTVEAVNAEAAAHEALAVLGWSVCVPSPADGARQVGISQQGRAVWQKPDGLPFIVLYNARNERSSHPVEEFEFTRFVTTQATRQVP